jgi:diguanylate cyclase (GGDEF)-like protein/PAS domain S-box-containing protein
MAVSVAAPALASKARIGVLAFRPKAQTLAQWAPLAQVLHAAIPEVDFEVEVFNLHELEAAVAARQVDFVLTNPGHYVFLSQRSGIQAPLATVLMDDGQTNVSAIGGVIFRRADDSAGKRLTDLTGLRIAAVGADSFAGYQIQAFELLRSGIDPTRVDQMVFTGWPQDRVVQEVLAGRADVGFVRTGVLEAMAREGALDLTRVQVINAQTLPGLPVVSSTPIYPDWPLSYVGHVDERLARRVAAALFQLDEHSPAAHAMRIHGFSVPADYDAVADLLRTLRLPPFERAPDFTLSDVVLRYRWALLVGAVAVLAILLLSLRLWLAGRMLRWRSQQVQEQQHELERGRRLLLKIIDHIPVRVFWKDRNLRYLGCNTLLAQDAGLASPQDIVGKTDLELAWREQAQAYREDDAAVMASGQPKLFFEELQTRPDGQVLWLRTSKVPLTDDAGQTFAVLGIYEDITCQKADSQQQQLAASVFRYAREGIAITDARGCIVDVNEAFSLITGYTRAEVLGQNTRILSSGRQDKAFYTAMYQELQAHGHWAGEIWNRRKSGEVYAEMLTISAVRDGMGRVTHYVALFFDITAIKEHERQLEHLAHFDALTNLPNRVLLADRLQQAMAQAQRRGQLLAVAYLDLDGFKTINDDHGHAAGDLLLVRLAEAMRHTLREGDTLARLGGDEFVVVMADLRDANDCASSLTRLLAAAAQPMTLDEQVLQVSASLGVTFFPQAESVDADQLMRQADQAMYQAKLAGKNRYHVFDAAQDRSVRGLHESLEEIGLALQRGEFVLYYQPKVNLHSGEVLGAEALIRWNHPVRGLLAPAAFLPTIEDHPLAVAVGEWVLDTAMRQLQSWVALGLRTQVSINVGARQLQQADFVKVLCDALARYPEVAPAQLTIEVLETSALGDLQRTADLIQSCARLGVPFALDDFGTGYSSLTYLKHLPVREIKIDQSFVRDMRGRRRRPRHPGRHLGPSTGVQAPSGGRRR